MTYYGATPTRSWSGSSRSARDGRRARGASRRGKPRCVGEAAAGRDARAGDRPQSRSRGHDVESVSGRSEWQALSDVEVMAIARRERQPSSPAIGATSGRLHHEAIVPVAPVTLELALVSRRLSAHQGRHRNDRRRSRTEAAEHPGRRTSPEARHGCDESRPSSKCADGVQLSHGAPDQTAACGRSFARTTVTGTPRRSTRAGHAGIEPGGTAPRRYDDASSPARTADRAQRIRGTDGTLDRSLGGLFDQW